MKTIALLHPGNMGATIGGAAVTGGARVLWASEQRSSSSRKRAEQAGLLDVETMTAAVGPSDAVLSVCPPHAALEVARSVAAQGFAGTYIDANAISRATAEEIGRDRH